MLLIAGVLLSPWAVLIRCKMRRENHCSVNQFAVFNSSSTQIHWAYSMQPVLPNLLPFLNRIMETLIGKNLRDLTSKLLPEKGLLPTLIQEASISSQYRAGLKVSKHEDFPTSMDKFDVMATINQKSPVICLNHYKREGQKNTLLKANSLD